MTDERLHKRSIYHDCDFTDDELIERLANLEHTGAMCIGHKKTDRCRRVAKCVRYELELRGVEVPPLKELWERGRFNGIGAV